MASKRDYGYYIKGNKIAIIERGIGSGVCSLSGYSNQTTCEAAGGTWTENAVSRDDGEWMSPIATVADGLEIQYAYSPEYRINDASDTIAATAYNESGGNLWFTVSSMSATAGDWILIRNSERWNGLHQVKDSISGAVAITFNTKYNGGAVTEASTLYQDISVLEDESSEIDLPRYQTNAITYYLKAKMAEDMGEMEQREFFMREFKRQLEKSTSALKRGPYIIQGFKEMR